MQNTIISSLEFRNFKCHKDFKQDINMLTILAGSNATGKSSVIQGILLANKAWREADKNKLQTNNIYNINLGQPASILSEEHDTGELVLKVSVDKFVNVIKLRLFEAEEDDLSFQIINRDSIVRNWQEKGNLKNVNLYYLNAERVGPRISSPITTIDDFYVGSFGENTNYVMAKMDIWEKIDGGLEICKLLKSSKISRFSANCEAWMDVIIPGTKLKISKNSEMNFTSIKYQNDGDYYLPTATGFGISYVLPIIVQALIATMKENAVLMVENPEAHLHPYSQSAMGKFLALVAMSGVQVILETHSEHIINGCRLQLAKQSKCDLMKVIFFDKIKDKSNYSSISVLDNGELEEWPEGFFDQTKKDLRELLEMRICGK